MRAVFVSERPETLFDDPTPLPRLIGLSGKKRAGKDTFAAGLIERGATRVAFADPLKEAALILDPLIGRPAFPGVLAPQTDVRLSTYVGALGWERAKECPEVRRTLQAFGRAVRALDPAFWLDAGLRSALTVGGSAVVTDVRYPNEADAISACGGVVVRIERPGLDTSDEDDSETALDDYPFDLVVVNDQSAEALFETARALSF